MKINKYLLTIILSGMLFSIHSHAAYPQSFMTAVCNTLKQSIVTETPYVLKKYKSGYIKESSRNNSRGTYQTSSCVVTKNNDIEADFSVNIHFLPEYDTYKDKQGWIKIKADIACDEIINTSTNQYEMSCGFTRIQENKHFVWYYTYNWSTSKYLETTLPTAWQPKVLNKLAAKLDSFGG